MVTSRIKVTLVKKIESGEGGMRLPIQFYSSILGWSAAAQLVWNLDANITIHCLPFCILYTLRNVKQHTE